jgi:DNA-binding transcriptional regulator YbjK
VARPKDQQLRRAQFGVAARKAVLRRGLHGLRLKDVADEAGVTPAAVLYYYRDLDELVAETYREAITRFCELREQSAEQHADAGDQLSSLIEAGVATGPDDDLVGMLFEVYPRAIRDPGLAGLDAILTERQIAVYHSTLTLGREQGRFELADSPRALASTFLAIEDGYQMEVLAGRRTHDEVVDLIGRYARTVTGHDPRRS